MTLNISTKHNLKVGPSSRNRNVRSVDNRVAGHQSWTAIITVDKGISIGRVIEELRMECPIAVNQGSWRDLNYNSRENKKR